VIKKDKADTTGQQGVYKDKGDRLHLPEDDVEESAE
jgi:hypothetical protein